MALKKAVLAASLTVGVVAAAALGIHYSATSRDAEYRTHLANADRLAAVGDRAGAIDECRKAILVAPTKAEADSAADRLFALGGKEAGPGVPPVARGPVASGPGVPPLGPVAPPLAPAAAAAAGLAPPPEFPDRMEEGESLAKEGRWAAALEAFERAKVLAASDGERAKADARVADAREALRRAAPPAAQPDEPGPGAGQAVAAAKSPGPRDFEVWLFEGDDRLSAGEEEEALASFRKALEAAPGEKERQTALARIDGLRARLAGAQAVAGAGQAAGASAAPPAASAATHDGDREHEGRRLEFERHFADGEGRRLAREWGAALGEYQEALACAATPEERKRVEERLAEAQARSDDARRAAEEAARAAAAGPSRDYARALAGGDASRAAGRIEEALTVYVQARGAASTAEESAEVETRIAAVQAELSYQQSLQAARAAIERADWEEAYQAARWAFLARETPEAQALLDRARQERALARRQAAFRRWLAEAGTARAEGRVADALYAYQRALDSASTAEERGQAKTLLDETAGMEAARQAFEEALANARAARAAGDWRTVDRWAREALRFAEGEEARALLAEARAAIAAEARRRSYARWMQTGQEAASGGAWEQAMAAFDRAAGFASSADEEQAARSRSRGAEEQLGRARAATRLMAEARAALCRGDLDGAWWLASRAQALEAGPEEAALLAEVQAAREAARRAALFAAAMSRGDAARAACDWQAALKAYQEAIGWAPSPADECAARHLLEEVRRSIVLTSEYGTAMAAARAAAARGDWAAVLTQAGRAYQIRPTDEAAHLVEESRAQGREAARRADFEAARSKARGFVMDAQFHAAEEWFEKAVALAPTPADATTARAELEGARHKHAVAEAVAAGRAALAAGNLDGAQAQADRLRDLGEARSTAELQARIDAARAAQGQRAAYGRWVEQGVTAANKRDWAAALAAFAQALSSANTEEERRSAAEWQRKAATGAEEARRAATEEAERARREEEAKRAREAAEVAAREAAERAKQEAAQRAAVLEQWLTKARQALAAGDFAAASAALERCRAIEDNESVRRVAAEIEAAKAGAAQNQAERAEAARREAERRAAEQRAAEQREADRHEAERRDAERKEAERQEAERKQAERREAERQEAERREAERRAAEEATARQAAERRKAALEQALAESRAALAAGNLEAARAACEQARSIEDGPAVRGLAAEIEAALARAAREEAARRLTEKQKKEAAKRAAAAEQALGLARRHLAAGDLVAARADVERSRSLADSEEARQVLAQVEAAEAQAAREAARQAAAQEAGRREAERQEAERREAERQEAQRREASRKEAQRREAERRETERREAERREAERQAAEEEARRRQPQPQPQPQPPAGGGTAVAVPTGYQAVGKNAQGCDEYRCPSDGAVMVLVPAGGSTGAFLMDKYEVSNAQYAHFCQATGRAVPADPGLPGLPNYAQAHPDYPVVMVSAQDAAAYAGWAGKSLPSGEQFARAWQGDAHRRFPWGNNLQPGLVNLNWGDAYPATAPVNALPGGSGPFGCLNLAGNVAEWLSDGAACGGGFETSKQEFMSQAIRSGQGHPKATGFRCAVGLR
ncbi:MAG: SUMF1/EgtB/PvdO family nonheme iron enzyme [Planctomycetes bacterium]|nr:SUMF1/EgtB/PvdO family nonheme iron enzyme [Planctomycetota bacterium]